MNERINDKIKEVESYLEDLTKIVPQDFEDYIKDFKTKAACERYAEKIIEAVVDLAFLVIKDNELKIPEDEESSFDILSGEDIITKDLAENLRKAKGMRNILAHEYGEVDNEIVFNTLSEELVKDTEDFIENINKRLKKKK